MGCLFCKKNYTSKKESFKKHRLLDNRFIGLRNNQINQSELEDIQPIVNVKVSHRNKRLIICRACPSLYSFWGSRRCRICGCFLAIKTTLLNTRCPLRKW